MGSQTTLVRRLGVLRDISETLNRSLTLRDALDGALHRIIALMDVRAAWVFLYDADTGEFRLAADVNLPAPLAGEGRRRMAGDCRCNQMLRDGTLSEAINLIDCARLERALPNDPQAQRHATVPLVGPDGPVGILNLLLSPGRALSSDDLDLLGAVGHELAVTIQRAALYERVRDHEHVRRQLLQRLLMVQEEERRRIAQDLHDHSGQMITAMAIRLDQLQAALREEGTVRATDLAAIKHMTDRLWEGLRRLIYDLRPPVLDDLGLAAAVRWYVDTYIVPSGIAVDVQIDGLQAKLPSELETAAFRILQEAVTNALRHAGTARMEIRINQKAGLLHLMVRDHGGGFDPQELRASGSLGIMGMRERAELLGGALQVLSAPGLGTTVLARLPVPADAPQHS